MILGVIFFLRYKKAISKTDAQAVGVMIGLSALGVIIQGVRSDLLVELFAESLTFLGLMVMLEERGGHIDPVTGALNRAALVDANRRLIETGQTYRVILLKLTRKILHQLEYKYRW